MADTRDQRKLSAYEITPANNGGFIVMGGEPLETYRDTPGRAYVRGFDFAGSLDDCLGYIRSKLEPPEAPGAPNLEPPWVTPVTGDDVPAEVLTAPDVEFEFRRGLYPPFRGAWSQVALTWGSVDRYRIWRGIGAAERGAWMPGQSEVGP